MDNTRVIFENDPNFKGSFYNLYKDSYVGSGATINYDPMDTATFPVSLR